ncbi:MAG: CheR family methyltransferase [Bryobacteraceae bacterium]
MANSSAEVPAELTGSEFARFRDLIHMASGIALGETKRELLESRLSGRLRELGLRGFSEYYELVTSPGSSETSRMINAVTTNLTSFFRERHHFDSLREWLQGRAAPARIWSTACSSGEEPYSIAIAAAMAGRPGTRILATDIDSEVLAAARRGVYRESAIDELPLAVRKLGFLLGKNAQRGQVKVKDEFRQTVLFAPLNLASAEWPRMKPMDAIFCRNVLIYFDPPTQREVVDRLVANLVPGGLLFLGHSESQAAQHELLEGAGVTTYLRRAEPRSPALGDAWGEGRGHE